MYVTDGNFQLCKMSRRNKRAWEEGSWLLFVSDLMLRLAPRHAITRSSESRPAPASKRAICMLGGFPLGTCVDSRLAQRR